MPPKLELFLDGLDASVDGRGFNAEHEAARKFVENAVGAHEDLLHAAQWALDHYNGKHMGANTVDLLAKAIAKARGEV